MSDRREREFDNLRVNWREPSLQQRCPMLSGAGQCIGWRDHVGPHSWKLGDLRREAAKP